MLCCSDAFPAGPGHQHLYILLVFVVVVFVFLNHKLNSLSTPLSSVFRAAVGRVHLVASGGTGQHRELDSAQTGPG